MSSVAESPLLAALHCEHEHSVLTFRASSNSYWMQCRTCGRAMPFRDNPVAAAIARRLLTPGEMAAAEPWDDDLQDRWWESHRDRFAREQEIDRKISDAAYQEYLHTPEWWDIRERVMARAHGMCEGCGRRRAQDVHHTTYDHRGSEFLFELLALCRDCHERWHQVGRYAGRGGE